MASLVEISAYIYNYSIDMGVGVWNIWSFKRRALRQTF